MFMLELKRFKADAYLDIWLIVWKAVLKYELKIIVDFKINLFLIFYIFIIFKLRELSIIRLEAYNQYMFGGQIFHYWVMVVKI